MEATLDELIGAMGLNASLPSALIETKTFCLVDANKRFLDILLLKEPRFPVAREVLERHWPFMTEEDGPLAVLDRMLNESSQLAMVFSMVTEARLKTYKLFAASTPPDRVVVQAELIRSGDLLTDEEARQNLFRALSHEIRTSVMALEGYVGILKDQVSQSEPQAEIVDRMQPVLQRLRHVVARLNDFRVEMDLKRLEKSKRKKKSS